MSLIFNHIQYYRLAFCQKRENVWAERQERLGRTLSGFSPYGKAKRRFSKRETYGLTTK